VLVLTVIFALHSVFVMSHWADTLAEDRDALVMYIAWDYAIILSAWGGWLVSKPAARQG
jgi:hypothetical protein